MTKTSDATIAKESQAAAEVLGRVADNHIVLMNCSGAVAHNNLPERMAFTVNLTSKTDLDRQQKLVATTVAFRLRSADEHGDTHPDGVGIDIAATYQFRARLSDSKGIRTTQADAFTVVYAIPAIWPYWTEFISSITSRMGIPPVRAPIFDRRMIQSPNEGRKPVKKKKTAIPQRKKGNKRFQHGKKQAKAKK